MQTAREWVGHTVDFDVKDAYIPTPAEILMQRYGDQILQGQVVDLTGPATPGSLDYAVLRVGGVRDLVIVPCARLRRSLLGRSG